MDQGAECESGFVMRLAAVYYVVTGTARAGDETFEGGVVRLEDVMVRSV